MSAANDGNERVLRLEEKLAYLERHVTAQDRAMLEFAGELAELRRELKAVRERAPGAAGGAEGEGAEEERPPHY